MSHLRNGGPGAPDIRPTTFQLARFLAGFWVVSYYYSGLLESLRSDSNRGYIADDCPGSFTRAFEPLYSKMNLIFLNKAQCKILDQVHLGRPWGKLLHRIVRLGSDSGTLCPLNAANLRGLAPEAERCRPQGGERKPHYLDIDTLPTRMLRRMDL